MRGAVVGAAAGSSSRIRSSIARASPSVRCSMRSRAGTMAYRAPPMSICREDTDERIPGFIGVVEGSRCARTVRTSRRTRRARPRIEGDACDSDGSERDGHGGSRQGIGRFGGCVREDGVKRWRLQHRARVRPRRVGWLSVHREGSVCTLSVCRGEPRRAWAADGDRSKARRRSRRCPVTRAPRLESRSWLW